MADHTDNDLRAAIQALTEVVTPAVDPGNQLARQQIALVVDALRFMRDRRPLLPRLDRAELAQQIAMARRAQAAAGPADRGDGAAALQQAIDDATALHALHAALGDTPDALPRCTSQLREATSALVQRAASFADAAATAAVEHAVLAGSQQWLDTRRAWFLPMSIELDPSTLPPLEAVLAPVPTSAGELS
jgi:hypothetical protein